MATLRRFAAAALFALLLAGNGFCAVYDPALEWRTVSTTHFFINYPEPLAPEAFHLAGAAEGIYNSLEAAYGFPLSSPVEVTLVDNTDLANGYATVLPFKQIVIYAVDPEFLSPIADYNDWLKSVFSHELAHIFTMSARRGYSKVTGRIFGEGPIPPLSGVGILSWLVAAPPNIFLPSWFHEGAAVNAESDLDGAGRRNSTYYGMIFRNAVAENNVPPLDRFIGYYPEWPSWSAPYVYGERLLDTAGENHGEKTIGSLTRQHSGRVPYAIDRAVRDVTGKEYPGLYDEMVAGLYAEYSPVVESLTKEGLTPVTPLTRSAYGAGAPRYLPDGRIVYSQRNPEESMRLSLLDPATGETGILALRPHSSFTTTSGPEGSILYTRQELQKPWAGGLLYSDLYSVKPGGDEVRLTAGERIRYVTSANGGKLLAGVFLDGPNQHLSTFTVEMGKAVEKVLLSESGARYDGPALSPDGSFLAFSRKLPGEKDRLALMNMETGKTYLLTPPDSRAGFPSFSPDSKKLLFSWDKTGVFDLYEMTVHEDNFRRLTRLVGGAFEGGWSPDGANIVFSSYSSKGFDLALLKYSDALNENAGKVLLEGLPMGGQAALPRELPPGASDEPYSPLRKLPPHFWLPDMAFDNAGNAPGLFTAGQDSLGKQAYGLSAFWSSGLDRPYYLFTYINDVWYPKFTLSAVKLPAAYAGLLETSSADYDYWEENILVDLTGELSLSNVFRDTSVSLGFAYERVGSLSRVEEDLGGNGSLLDRPFRGRQSYLHAGLAYDSTLPYATFYTLGPLGGRRVELEARVRGEALGSERDSREGLVKWSEYFRLPYRTAFDLKGILGIGRGDQTLQSLFQLGGEGEFPLRGYGYKVDEGTAVFAGSAEYLFPLAKIYRGIDDAPFFLDRFYGAIFYDAGRVLEGGDGQWRRSAGGEARIETVLGYYLPITVAVGYAHGFDEDGEEGIYFRVLIPY
ncbi:hypothetical protein EPN96_06840 [bacterium]|nr:MAG: hypothetical protein EPN96_06840 [bacterium]